MNVALVYGSWGQNIGNAFFNLGGAHCLEQAGHNVSLIQDQPAYATFRDESKGNFGNAFDLISTLDVDCVVLQGPLFTKNFGNIWRPTLETLKRRGVGWAVLSGSFRKFSQEEVRVLADVCKFYPPVFISTRDSEAFDALPSGLNKRSGVCSAFFLPRVYQPPKMVSAGKGFVSMCFDHYPEPDLAPEEIGELRIGEDYFSASYPKLQTRLADRSKAHAYIGAFADRRKLPTELGEFTVLRPEHRSNPHLPVKIYRQSNSFAWDEPYTYLTAYANSKLTLSDRVHACVATIAYGNEAMLFNPSTRRHALFDSVGAGDVTQKPVSVSSGLLDEHFSDVIEYLSREI